MGVGALVCNVWVLVCGARGVGVQYVGLGVWRCGGVRCVGVSVLVCNVWVLVLVLVCHADHIHIQIPGVSIE